MTFDRYLLRNFWHTFAICFVALFGLIVVIDLLENLDEFIKLNEGRGLAQLLVRIGWFYTYQSVMFLARGGAPLTVISVIVVLILFQRSGELHPLLAAGISMWRVLSPLVVATMLVSTFLVVNQEFVVPNFANAAMEGRGVSSKESPPVESAHDHYTRITLDGKRLLPAEKTIELADFVLPPGITEELTILKAEKAVFRKGENGRKSGWYLFQCSPKFEELNLTDAGEKFLREEPRIHGVFVESAITPDQLYLRTSNYAMLSSWELLQRVRNPAFGIRSAHRLVLHLHMRCVQPLMNVIAVLCTIPLMVRRESPGLVVDSALCIGVQGLMFGLIQGCQFLGMSQLLPPDLAAWLPVIFGGGLAALLSGSLRT